MTIKYATKDAHNINAAWASLIHFADSKRFGEAAQLCAALKAERRETSSRVAAKALLLRTLAESCDASTACSVNTLADLWTLRSAHRDLVAFAHHYREALEEAGVLANARTAASIHNAAFRRALEEK